MDRLSLALEKLSLRVSRGPNAQGTEEQLMAWIQDKLSYSQLPACFSEELMQERVKVAGSELHP